jgi:hypothetical protein
LIDQLNRPAMQLTAVTALLVALGQAATAIEPSAVAPESRGTFRGRPTVSAVRVGQAPDIDGHLGDEAWRLAKPAGEFLEKSPGENIPHTQRTEFRVVYDDDALYVGVWCFDTEPSRIIAHNMERDGHMRYEDVVNVTLDTFLDRRNGYYFSINPNGARGDASISNNTQLNREWDGAWLARSQRQAWGWSTEIAIPFKSVSFNETSNSWGLNVYRNIGRAGERGQWANSRSPNRSYYVSECGDLTGLFSLKQGLGLDINPYAIGKYQKDYDAKDSDLLGEFGFDARYRLTPSLTALASVNTDFAETETDVRQVNFTRFPLFFPEKRQFFLEDSGIFGFGGGESSRRRSGDSSDTLLMPFFSRRIGLSRTGQIVPIQFAGKVTGRIGDYNIGLLDAVLDGEDGPRNAFVGRVSRNVFEQSSVGFLTTIGDPNSDEMNAVTGIDFQYRNSDFMGGHTFELNLYALGSHSEETGGLDPAWGASTKLYDRNIDLSASVMEIGDAFNPAMGFVRRRGTRVYKLAADYLSYYDDIDWLRNTRHGYEAEVFTDLGNDVVNTKQQFNLGSLYLESQDIIGLSVSHVTDRPDTDFDISDGSVVPAGNYDWWEARVYGYLGMHRKLFLRPMYRVGGFYDGTRQQISLETFYRPWPKLLVGGEYSLNLIDWDALDESTIRLISGTLRYSFTPDLVWFNLAQYDNISKSLGVNSRLQWEYKPGAKIFFVVNQGYVDEQTGLVMKDFEVVAKVGALFRF